MPELGAKEALLSFGSAAVIGMFYFYRRKHTVGFKVRAVASEQCGRVQFNTSL
jgi:hypothetical protein